VFECVDLCSGVPISLTLAIAIMPNASCSSEEG
jgi:hypothetical protein